jgi:hypothetical protein
MKLVSINAAIEEITSLHGEVIQEARTTLRKAIRIGELLTSVKPRLGHGKWLPWLAANVPFRQETASDYMRCYQQRDKFKSGLKPNLTQAVKMLRDPDAKPRGRKRSEPLQSNGTKPTYGERIRAGGLSEELMEEMEQVQKTPAFQAKVAAKSQKARQIYARGLKLSNTLQMLAEACDANGGKLAVLVGEYDIRIQHLSPCDMP